MLFPYFCGNFLPAAIEFSIELVRFPGKSTPAGRQMTAISKREWQMSGKTILAVTAAVMLASVGSLIARKSDDASGVTPTQSHHLPSVEQEKRILNVLEQMLVGPHSDILSVPPEDGRVLRLLAEAAGAKHIVELRRHLVLPGPADDRRQADDIRDRRRTGRSGPGKFQAGRRRGACHPHRGRCSQASHRSRRANRYRFHRRR